MSRSSASSSSSGSSSGSSSAPSKEEVKNKDGDKVGDSENQVLDSKPVEVVKKSVGELQDSEAKLLDNKPPPEIARFLARQQKGIYVPPQRRKQLEKYVPVPKDRNSRAYQEMTWFKLRKGIHGLINRITGLNIKEILTEIFQFNLVRGRGILIKALMKAQITSPTFTPVYAAFLAVINTKLPEIGELLLSRVVIRFRQAYQRKHKPDSTGLIRFIAHLVNQQVAHEILSLQIIHLLLINPTDDSVELAIEFTKQVGQHLGEVIPKGLHGTFEQFRSILHEGLIHERVQYLIEDLFVIRKNGFEKYPSILRPQLDLVESEDQITHSIQLDDELTAQEEIDSFRLDPAYEESELMWSNIQKEILGVEEEESEGSSTSGSDSESSDESIADIEVESTPVVVAPIDDLSETEIVRIRRNIYLTIMSSLSFEECAHKLVQLNLKAGLESELVNMIIECCSQEKTYLKYYGLLAERFCLLSRAYQVSFADAFAEQYDTIHRLETNKLLNVARLFAHILFTDALPWTVFQHMHLNEEDTTSASRIFIKILCTEISDSIGLAKLKERFADPSMQQVFANMFPLTDLRATRFSINFFTAIGLGAITEDMREHLKNAPKVVVRDDSSDSDSSSSSSSSSSGSSSSGSSSSSSRGSSSRRRRRRRSPSSSDTDAEKAKRHRNSNSPRTQSKRLKA